MRRYLTFLLFTVGATVLPPSVMSVHFENLSGDLTRVGAYPEKDFGWNKEQPVIHLQKNLGNPEDAGIVVLGDSFSNGNLWQSALTNRTGKHIVTYHFNHVGCIDNWIKFVIEKSSAQTVIIQTVERVFAPRFRKIAECRKTSPSPIRTYSGSSEPSRKNWPPDLKITHTLRSLFNSLTIDQDAPNIRGPVINSSLVENCSAFSSRRSRRLLYYHEDEEKASWSPEDIGNSIANLTRLQQQLAAHDKQLIFLVVPDKLSVYGDCILEKSDSVKKALSSSPIATLAGSSLSAPDLLTTFKNERNRIADLYFPNDSHLSTAGYQLLADRIADHLARVTPDSGPAPALRP